MGKLKKMVFPAEHNEFIYVPKKAIDLIYKKAIILKQNVIGGVGGKLVIEYKSKSGTSHGVIELYDMRPDIPKKLKNESEEN